MGEPLKPLRRFFLLYEGSRTEQAYFSELLLLLNRMGLPKYVAVERCERTENDETASNPRRLLRLAESEIKEGDSFAEGDEIAIVFDVDIYAHKPGDYESLLAEFAASGMQPYVTFPSFELFLLLHLEDGYIRWVEPNESLIVENRKEHGRRYVDRLFSRASGMNPKRNPRVGELAAEHERACKEETRLNQDPKSAIGRLTSNVGVLIEKLKSS